MNLIMNLWLESEEINFEKLEKMPLEHDENIATTLLVFTSIVLSQKHRESEFRYTRKVWENRTFQGQVFLTHLSEAKIHTIPKKWEKRIQAFKNYGLLKYFT